MNTREIIVVVQLRLDANHRDEFLRTLYDIVERSRIAPECLSYELFSRAEDENTLVLFQMWSTREAFEQNWLYTDLPRINTNSHLLAAAMESWELLHAVVKNLRSVFSARPRNGGAAAPSAECIGKRVLRVSLPFAPPD